MTNEEAIEYNENLKAYMRITDKESEYKFLEENYEALDMGIKALEQQRWIPVTEDTPPKGTICLWCNKQGSVFTSAITYRSECSSYVGKHGYFSNGLENYGDIVAWMPLPQPYKAESEDAK